MSRLFKYSALIFLLWCSEVSAFEVCKTSGNSDIKWNTLNVTYYINTTGGPSGSFSAIQAAIQTWTDVTTSSFTFIYGGSTSSTAHGVNDGVNIITFGAMGTTGTLAVNADWYYVSTGQMIDSDIRFNTDYSWATTGSSSAYDVQNIGTHEHGHSLCLKDIYNSADSEKTMYGYASLGETKKRTLDPDDINGIAYLYPTLSVTLTPNPSSGTAPLNTNLTADVSDTVTTETINYTFWWNCNDPGTSVEDVIAVCGTIPTPSSGTCASNENGIKCDAVTDDPMTVSHTYSTAGTYTAKVIAEQGSAPPAEDRVTITVTELPSCPSLYFWNGSDYERRGFIFPGAMPREKEYRDHIPLKLVPKDGQYYLQIRETEPENSFIDMAKLIIVDHSSDTGSNAISISRDPIPTSHTHTSEILYKNKGYVASGSNVKTLSPTSATHSVIGNVLPLLRFSDDRYVKTYPGDIITLTFPYLSLQDEVRDFIFVGEGFYVPLNRP